MIVRYINVHLLLLLLLLRRKEGGKKRGEGEMGRQDEGKKKGIDFGSIITVGSSGSCSH